MVIVAPEQIVCEGDELTATGEGLTSTVAVIDDPEQPFAVGVMVKVTRAGLNVLFTKTPEIFPEPLDDIPVTSTVLSRVQL